MNSLRLPAHLLLFWFFALAHSPAAEPPATPVLRIEAGMHTAPIDRISADAAGRLVLTVSDDKTARLWELPSGRLLRVLRPPLGEGNEGMLYAGALSPDGALAAVGGWTSSDRVGATNSSVYLFDTATGRIVRRLEGLPNVILDLAFSEQGRFLAAGLFGGNGLRVWETATGREVGRDTDYGKRDSNSVDWHGEDRIVTTCYDGKLRLYRLAAGSASGKADGKLTLLKQSAVKGGKELHCARFSPDGQRIAVGFEDSTSVAVVDGNDLSFLFAPDTTGIDNGYLTSIVWTNDGATLAAGGGWTRGLARAIRQWPKAGRGKPQDSMVTSNTIQDLRSLSGGRILFGASDPSWGILRPTGEHQLFGAPPIADYRDDDTMSHFRFASDGATFTFGYEQLGRIPAQFSLAGRQLTLLKNQTALNNLQAPQIEGLKVTDWKNTAAPKLDGQLLPLERYESSRSVAIARDASSFLLGADWHLRTFTAEGKGRWKTPAPGVAWAVNLVDNDHLAAAAYGDGTIRWHRADTGQELLAFFPHADRKRWVLWATQYRLSETDQPLWGADWSKEADEKYYVRNVLPGTPAAGAGLRDGDLFVKYLDDTSKANLEKVGGRVRLAVKRNGKEIHMDAIVAARQEEKAQAVYYDCSPGAEELIGWHLNRGKDHEADFFPAAKFRDQFYRPDVIDRVLETRDVAIALKEANDAAGRKTQPGLRIEDVVAKMQPPVVELAVGGARGEASVPGSADTFTVRYRVRRGGAEAVTRVGVLVDGRPVGAEAPIPANDTSEASASVPLPSRDCVISVLAQNKFAVSEPATLRIIHEVTPAAEPAALKPKLYLFAAGIAHYKNNDQLPNLTYPPKDATDFAAAFKRQEGVLYQKVETRVLSEDQAGASDIRNGLDWIKHQTTSRDVAVIFLSGHGENDEELRFFFCGKDYDRAQRLNTGVSFEDIKRTIASMPGKVLFFIDSCHAGNALGKLFAAKGAGNDLTQVINELSSAESGAVVFASSTGRQQSLESDEWKNGAFTKAIVEGLDGKADLLQHGKITVSMLEAFIAERVKELTEGRQTPTVAKPQTVQDFPIAVKR